MSYIVICQKPDGSIDVAAHPGEATPEMLQDVQPAQNLDEALQLARDVLGEGGQGDESAAHEGAEGQGAEALEGGAGNDTDAAMPPSGAEGMPMESEDDQMAAGFKRAKKGY